MEPATLSDALEALASARTDLSALEALSNEHHASLEALAEAKRDNSALVLAIENLQTEKAALEASLKAAKAAEADANAKAVEIVASLGIEPVAIVSEATPARQSLAERLEGVTDPRERGRIRQEFVNSQNS
jgi:dihydroxyacetone kinase